MEWDDKTYYNILFEIRQPIGAIISWEIGHIKSCELLRTLGMDININL